MSININLEKLKEHLPASVDPSHYPPGLFVIIDIAHNEAYSNAVDWGSFTLQEAEMALDHAMSYVSYEELDEQSGHPNKGNAIHEFLHTTESMSRIKRTQSVIQADEDIQFF